jgi:hypothetical protein
LQRRPCFHLPFPAWNRVELATSQERPWTIYHRLLLAQYDQQQTRCHKEQPAKSARSCPFVPCISISEVQLALNSSSPAEGQGMLLLPHVAPVRAVAGLPLTLNVVEASCFRSCLQGAACCQHHCCSFAHAQVDIGVAGC